MEDQGGRTFTFVSGGIERALRQARPAGGGRDLDIMGGAVAGRQFLAGGFVDEIRLHLVHILLGAGTPLFETSGGGYGRRKESVLRNAWPAGRPPIPGAVRLSSLRLPRTKQA